MIFNSDFNVISDLIIKDLLGSISSLERCRLNCLIDKYGLSGRSCLDKKLIFEKTLSSFDDNIYSIETKLAYRKFKTLKKKNNSNTQFFKYCSVAASVLLILSLFLFAKQILCPRSVNLDQGSIVKNHYFNNLITPNDNTPIIVLSSGLRIPINDENLEIRESGGTVLNISKRELCYTDDPLGFKFPRSINNLWNTLYVPSGSDYNVILADGSEIKVNSKSSIRFKINDTQDDRVVYLSGEAYFKVENIDNKPFVVRTSKGDLKFPTCLTLIISADNSFFIDVICLGNHF